MPDNRTAIAPPAETRYAITVWFDIAPGRMDEFLVHMHENARASVADEPGCLRFDVLRPQGPEHGNRIFLYEIYEDRAAFEAHLASRHFKSFDAATQTLVIAKSVQVLQAWENVKGRDAAPRNVRPT
jgi:quinol monooxygenase YgiN